MNKVKEGNIFPNIQSIGKILCKDNYTKRGLIAKQLDDNGRYSIVKQEVKNEGN